jgi:hypothetical protein
MKIWAARPALEHAVEGHRAVAIRAAIISATATN